MRETPPFALNINNVPSVKETLHLNWKHRLNRSLRRTRTCMLLCPQWEITAFVDGVV